jgi:hypothetical protein
MIIRGGEYGRECKGMRQWNKIDIQLWPEMIFSKKWPRNQTGEKLMKGREGEGKGARKFEDGQDKGRMVEQKMNN